MSCFRDGVNELRLAVNGRFVNREPWQIIAITATTVLGLVWLKEFLEHDDSLIKRGKKLIFRLMRHIPSVQRKIDTELNKLADDFKRSALERTKGVPYITNLPEDGLTKEEIIDCIQTYLELGHYKWKDGQVSGTVYYYDQQLIDLNTAVYGITSYTNPLHSDIFPGVCKMEAEVVRMTANLFNGGPKSCGTMTTGGTESIMMACKAYRDYAIEHRGVKRPNIVMPTTAHTAFDKASQYFQLAVRTVSVDPKTLKVDVKAMEKSINKNTVMLVGSAPNYPYGTMDDITAIAALGRKYNIPVHVDACLGGFVIIFMKRAGFELPPFDFSVQGVTSISADTHKYGFAPKGSSVILYSEEKYRHFQYTVSTEWPGGVYGSPTVNGSRTGGIIATCWATMLNFGEKKYVEATKRIVDTAKYIEKGLREFDEIYVFGEPATTVIAFGSKLFDIYRLSDAMGTLGWNLNALQFPSAIHLCVTYVHTQPGVADKFLVDIKGCIKEMMKNPEAPVEGKMAVYGLAQSLPDRSLVSDFTKTYIDSMYYTPK